MPSAHDSHAPRTSWTTVASLRWSASQTAWRISRHSFRSSTVSAITYVSQLAPPTPRLPRKRRIDTRIWPQNCAHLSKLTLSLTHISSTTPNFGCSSWWRRLRRRSCSSEKGSVLTVTLRVGYVKPLVPTSVSVRKHATLRALRSSQRRQFTRYDPVFCTHHTAQAPKVPIVQRRQNRFAERSILLVSKRVLVSQRLL